MYKFCRLPLNFRSGEFTWEWGIKLASVGLFDKYNVCDP